MEQKKLERNEKKRNKQKEKLMRKQAQIRSQRDSMGLEKDDEEEKKPS